VVPTPPMDHREEGGAPAAPAGAHQPDGGGTGTASKGRWFAEQRHARESCPLLAPGAQKY
jgi:hypothetical protein